MQNEQQSLRTHSFALFSMFFLLFLFLRCVFSLQCITEVFCCFVAPCSQSQLKWEEESAEGIEFQNSTTKYIATIESV